jgi:Uma2 family endonuclease
VTAQAEHANGDRLTWAEFLRFQQAYDGDERFVWDEGRVVLAMTGGTERHDLTVMGLVRALDAAFRSGPCRVFAHNRQIKTARRSYYPDVLVRCGPAAHPLYEDDARFVIEVLSPTTTAGERTRMLFDYQALPSIEAILFIDTKRRLITVHEKTTEGWTESATKQGVVVLGPASIHFEHLWDQVDEDATFD